MVAEVNVVDGAVAKPPSGGAGHYLCTDHHQSLRCLRNYGNGKVESITEVDGQGWNTVDKQVSGFPFRGTDVRQLRSDGAGVNFWSRAFERAQSLACLIAIIIGRSSEFHISVVLCVYSFDLRSVYARGRFSGVAPVRYGGTVGRLVRRGLRGEDRTGSRREHAYLGTQ